MSISGVRPKNRWLISRAWSASIFYVSPGTGASRLPNFNYIKIWSLTELRRGAPGGPPKIDIDVACAANVNFVRAVGHGDPRAGESINFFWGAPSKRAKNLCPPARGPPWPASQTVGDPWGDPKRVAPSRGRSRKKRVRQALGWRITFFWANAQLTTKNCSDVCRRSFCSIFRPPRRGDPRGLLRRPWGTPGASLNGTPRTGARQQIKILSYYPSQK